MVEYAKCSPEDVIDKDFWTDKSIQISKHYLHVGFRQVVEVSGISQESQNEPTESDVAASMYSVAGEQVEPEKAKKETMEEPIDEAKSAPESSQFEEKYNRLYSEYVNIKKERDELRRKLEETEIRKDLTQKKDNATKSIIPNEGYGIKEVSITAGVFLLIGMILPNIIRLLLT